MRWLIRHSRPPGATTTLRPRHSSASIYPPTIQTRPPTHLSRALEQLVEGLPADTRFGLATYSDRLTVFDLRVG